MRIHQEAGSRNERRDIHPTLRVDVRSGEVDLELVALRSVVLSQSLQAICRVRVLR